MMKIIYTPGYKPGFLLASPELLRIAVGVLVVLWLQGLAHELGDSQGLVTLQKPAGHSSFLKAMCSSEGVYTFGADPPEKAAPTEPVIIFCVGYWTPWWTS